MALRLYSIFHCNIAFSSIAEDKRPIVVERCYWPLLRLARKHKIGIEINGYTLEVVEKIDPKWIAELKKLIAEGHIELLASGYVQMIGPLVPASVTEKNLELGKNIYRIMLDVSPRVAYLNEQTYSAGMPEMYSGSGFEALVADWNNAYFLHQKWDPLFQYRVCRAQGIGETSIPIIWTNYIAFQKFQRYAHGELSLEKYLSYLYKHAEHGGNFPLYGNDVEIFDFRPGRFKNEPTIGEVSEWKKIEELYNILSKDKRFEIVLPSTMLDAAGKDLPLIELQTAEFPIPVKKQEKYNPIRWGLTGRDDIFVNTQCYRIEKMLGKCPRSEEVGQAWKDLCYAWDSDFRTHITLPRFEAYRIFINDLEKKAATLCPTKTSTLAREEEPMKVSQDKEIIALAHPNLNVSLIIRRGLALNDLTFPAIDKKPLVRTLQHGYYNDVPLGADYYSGNTRIEIPGKISVTDLESAKDIVISHSPAGTVVEGSIETPAGTIKKKIIFKPSVPSVTIAYEFNLSLTAPLSFKTGNVTLNPEAFMQDKLFYRTHNGGKSPETFLMHGVEEIDPGPLSLLCSARTALGNTTGLFEFGDDKKHVWVKTNMDELAALPMLMYRKTKESYLFRVMYSLAEFDDTVAVRGNDPLQHLKFSIEIGAKK